jgi:hypothetical protein
MSETEPEIIQELWDAKHSGSARQVQQAIVRARKAGWTDEQIAPELGVDVAEVSPLAGASQAG